MAVDAGTAVVDRLSSFEIKLILVILVVLVWICSLVKFK